MTKDIPEVLKWRITDSIITNTLLHKKMEFKDPKIKCLYLNDMFGKIEVRLGNRYEPIMSLEWQEILAVYRLMIKWLRENNESNALDTKQDRNLKKLFTF